METFLKTNTSKNRYLYQDSICSLECYPENIIFSNKKEGHHIDFISNNKKFVFHISGSYYHFIIDQLSSMFELINLHKDIEIIFFTHLKFNSEDDYPNYLHFVINKLKYLNVKYSIVKQTDYEYIVLDNFFMYNNDDYFMNESVIKNLELFFECNFTKRSNKKVYASRLSILQDELLKTNYSKFPELFDNIYFIRIRNEYILENYFRSKGFEIFYPELFSSYEDQVKYFGDVGLLVSCTSSGLTNQIFMPEGSTVVELVTPMWAVWDNRATKGIHHFFSTIAYLKKHLYVGLNNENRDAYSIIESIDNNHVVREIVNA